MANFFERSWALDNIEISRSYSDGRTVEAYAAVFNIHTEVHDQYGHYLEAIDRSAFNRTLKNNGASRVMVLYNHGMNVVDGKPNPMGQVPLGTPLEIKADHRGLMTVTRYNRSELADSVLEAIRNGDIRAQSFRGAIHRSNPMRVPKVRTGQPLPSVTRMELGLSDYGPTPLPYYKEAEIVAVRSIQEIAEELKQLEDSALAELIRTLSDTRQMATSENSELGAVDSRNSHSNRQRRLRLAAEMRFRGVL